MRMTLGVFWGIVLMLIGLSIIINVVFRINIPVFKIIIALLLIYLGVRILVGPACWPGIHCGRTHDVLLSERTLEGLQGDRTQYDVVFGKAVIDLRNVKLQEKVTNLKVDVVFGSAEILLNKSMPVKINADTAFGGIRLPVNNAGGFGSATYASENFDENANYLYIKLSAVFSGIEVRYQ